MFISMQMFSVVCSQCMEVLGKEKFDKVQRYCERNGVPEMRYCCKLIQVASQTNAAIILCSLLEQSTYLLPFISCYYVTYI